MVHIRAANRFKFATMLLVVFGLLGYQISGTSAVTADDVKKIKVPKEKKAAEPFLPTQI